MFALSLLPDTRAEEITQAVVHVELYNASVCCPCVCICGSCLCLCVHLCNFEPSFPPVLLTQQQLLLVWPRESWEADSPENKWIQRKKCVVYNVEGVGNWIEISKDWYLHKCHSYCNLMECQQTATSVRPVMLCSDRKITSHSLYSAVLKGLTDCSFSFTPLTEE